MDAGEGTLEIGITGPTGANIHSNVTSSSPGQFEVTCVPLEFSQHRRSITFNKENAPGLSALLSTIVMLKFYNIK